jgi:hypothetical protein
MRNSVFEVDHRSRKRRVDSKSCGMSGSTMEGKRPQTTGQIALIRAAHQRGAVDRQTASGPIAEGMANQVRSTAIHSFKHSSHIGGKLCTAVPAGGLVSGSATPAIRDTAGSTGPNPARGRPPRHQADPRTVSLERFGHERNNAPRACGISRQVRSKEERAMRLQGTFRAGLVIGMCLMMAGRSPVETKDQKPWRRRPA